MKRRRHSRRRIATISDRTVAGALRAARDALGSDDVRAEDARLDVARLFEAASGHDAGWQLAHATDALDEQTRARFDALIARRARGEPVAYLAGSAGFFGRDFIVTPDVLVPRPETERIVELACETLRAAPFAALPFLRLCDVGTGSGVLALTLCAELPKAYAIAIDVSVPALGVAERNARALGVWERVAFQLGDALEGIDDPVRFDCVVANLPYVRTGELRAAPDPTSFEPRIALDGGPDGLALYRRLLARVPAFLATPGIAFFEAGPDTAGPLAALAASALPHASVEIVADYAARERVVAVRAEG